MRDALPDPLAAWLDLQDGLDRQAHLRTLLTLSRDNGWEHAVKAMDDTLEATGGLDPASVELQASRLAAGQDPIEYDDPIDLSEYDIIGKDVTRLLHYQKAEVWVECIERPILRKKGEKEAITTSIEVTAGA